MAQDLRFALRTLRSTPGFTVIVLLTLALGVGANTAIFSLTDQLLLRLLPVSHPEQLVMFENPGAFSGRQENNNTFSYPMYRDFRGRNTVFDGVLASFPTNLTLTVDCQAERVNGELVSGDYFDVLGVMPSVGRAFAAGDDRTPGAGTVAIMSFTFWQRRFGGSPTVLNRTIGLNGHPMTVVGIAPRGFFGVVIGQSPDVFVPVSMKAQMTPTWDDLENRRSRWLTLVARRKPDVSIEQVEASMNVLYRQINEHELTLVPNATERFKDRFINKRLIVRDGARGRSDIRRQFSTPIVVLMGMVGVVLLIACANVANLLLARGAARQREVAIRLALGASRGAVIRQRLLESGLLALGGAAIGIPLAWWAGDVLVNAVPGAGVSRTISASPDLRVIGFALAVSAVTALLFGLVPALQSTKPVLTTTLKDLAGSVAGGTGHSRFRKTLVVAQVGLSVLLLAGAMLFARSLFNLKNLDPGFESDALLSFSVDPALSGYARDRSANLFLEMQRRIASIPDVRAVAPSVLALMTDSQWSSTIRVGGYTARDDEDMNPLVNAVGPGYFATLGQPLLVGRDFTNRDVLGAPKVAVINETMAKYFFGTESPLGRRFGFRRSNAFDIEIVGVVKDSKMARLREPNSRFIYVPYMQEDALSTMTFYVKTRGDATAAASSIRAAVQQIDPNLPIFDMKTMEAQLDESLFVERMVAALSVAFGALATLLAAIGLYGVMSYTVARRTREIGVRIALGAEQGSVLWLVLREVGIMVAAGIAIGLPLAAAFSRVVQTQLFELPPNDPITLGSSAVLLGAVGLLAGYLPARRATRVDPIFALRYE